MQHNDNIEFDDMQVLLRFGNGTLTETAFLLLVIRDARAARQWLGSAPISDAVARSVLPDTSLQIAFSAQGLAAVGLDTAVIDGFSDEFIVGMSGDESRSRRLGDIGSNAPERWEWGGDPDRLPHVLLLLYAREGRLPAWREQVTTGLFTQAFDLAAELPTDRLEASEPFGFVDGISQPAIDWHQQQGATLHGRDEYSNWLALGDVTLGYANEYGLYTGRPLIDPWEDAGSAVLPDAEDEPGKKDFGRNGCYLVIRQLQQDVPGFWQFIDRAAGADAEKREQLAASMVGRQRDGTPLVPPAVESVPGIPTTAALNQFTFLEDPDGAKCPVGAHIRRTNPRSGDYPPGITGLFSWLVRVLGFGLRRPDADLIASSRFHRLVRRGRGYGPPLAPEEAVRPNAPVAARGLQFICLVGNITRQFEFIQNAWIANSKFGGVQDERDPLLGTGTPLWNDTPTDCFRQPDAAGPVRTTCGLPQFVTVRGGGYFFMPGLRALQYLAKLPVPSDGMPS
ncbi:MAG: hypothetical protein WBN68_11870 [Sedimenticolaceae bacterium]